MNSTIEYIRQLNQASVAVQAEWLDRLRHIDVGSDAQVATPEIVLTSRTDIPNYTKGDFKPPITMVQGKSEESAAPIPDQTVAASTPPQPSAMPTIPEVEVQVVTPTAVQHQDWGSQITALPTSANITGIEVSSRSANSSTREEETATETPTPTQPETPIATSPRPVQPTGSELESPAILNDIVRPTIMPLRQQPGTDVISSDRSAGNQAGSIGSAPIQQNQTANPKEILSTAGAKPEIILTPRPQEIANGPAQVIEMLGDFGLSGDAIYSNDTISSEDMAELITTNQPVDDNPEVVTGPASSRTCAFPIDKRAERFSYAKTKRQKLVDSIVDQIVERFPAGTNPTIMLVGANREIDVDSAASRIATCLASRNVGEILLVDGNLQSGQLTSLLALVGEPGISDACQSKADTADLICQTDNPRLKIIGAGTVDCSNKHNVLPAVSSTNNSLKEQFDYTVVAGGVAGDELTDAWSAVADGVYLIVDMDESDRGATVSTVDYFRKIGARIVGCIATRA